MEIEYVCLTPAHSRKLCLLQAFHVPRASDDVGSHDDEKFGSKEGVGVIAEEIFEQR